MSSETEQRSFVVSELIDAGVLEIGDGYRAKNSELGHPGLPFARAGNINNGFDFSSADRVPPHTLAKVGRKRSMPGDVVFTSKGTVGRFAWVRDDTEAFVYSPQLCFWRSIDHDAVLPRFLYYWMQGAECVRQIDALKGQTDMADYVSLRDQRSMRITVPPLVEQHSVQDVLGTVDDKIESNRRIESLAACAIGTAFEEFCVRTAPESWTRASLAEIAAFVNGKNFTRGATGDGRPVLRIKELNSGLSTSTVRNDVVAAPANVASHFDLLFAWSGTLGVHRWDGPEALVNQHIFKVVPSSYPTWWVECWLRRHLDRFQRIAKDKAVTMGHIRRGDLDEAEVLVPPPAELAALDARLSALDRLRAHAALEARSLTALRDELLPKLITGQIRVPESLSESMQDVAA